MDFHINLFIFCHSNLRLIHIFVLQKFIVKSVYIFIENNYINIFIFKLLMYNQSQILDLKSFMVCFRCPKKKHFEKIRIVTQKVNHFNGPSPWWFTLSLSSSIISLCILSTRVFFIKFFCFFGKFTFCCLFALERLLFFLFSSTRFIVVSLHKLNTKQH